MSGAGTPRRRPRSTTAGSTTPWPRTTRRCGAGWEHSPSDATCYGVSGDDARYFLQGQLSQDIDALGVGESADSLLLTPQGKLDALVHVSRTGEDELVLDVDAGWGEAVAARLARFKLRVKVVIEPLAWRCVALRGPGAAAAVVEGRPDVSLSPAFSWNGVAGFDLLGEAPEIPDGVRVCSGAAWESVRVEAGIPRMGAELDERTIAAEADLLDRAVSFTKGCYTGQELVARLDARGNRVARRLPRAGRVGLDRRRGPGHRDRRPGQGRRYRHVVGVVPGNAVSRGPGLRAPRRGALERGRVAGRRRERRDGCARARRGACPPTRLRAQGTNASRMAAESSGRHTTRSGSHGSGWL